MTVETVADVDTLRQLEESLWQSSTRFDRAYMETVLAPDFVEFGRSGRAYYRAACLDLPAWQFDAELRQMQVRFLHPDIALITYVSVVAHEAIEYANRSSLWSRTGSGWLLCFHQGTPRADDEHS
jgi:hypothetical protein